ncbi:hypothetical protein CARUB_v10001898mg [Capsella rubella]|uniref:Uncharacterized protein n=1 Tax=Capsella rubella TaxID=81985 RepID=R0H7E5_9BRAS|nr:hypothetical protein CARUB_v10001898mg [Capsella rubella]
MSTPKNKERKQRVPNISQRPRGSNPPPPTPQAGETALYLHSTISQPQTPQEPIREEPQASPSATPHFRNFPPPQSLFQISVNEVRRDQPTRSSLEVQTSRGFQPQDHVHDPPESPVQHSHVPSHLSSQGHNFEPDPMFDRDPKLVRMITKVLTNKFNGPFYSWSCVPQDRRERYIIEFAKTHTWDPLIIGTVQKKFEKVCQRRIKDMVSNVRTSRERPTWIVDTLW